jgi:PLD-like domain
MEPESFAAIGEFLTATEASRIAAVLAASEHTMVAVREVHPDRRSEAKRLLAAAGLGHTDVGRSVAVLLAIAGAKALRQQLTPVWTMPGNLASVGYLTGEFYRLVQSARLSVTCATYNFETTSRMWTELKYVSDQPDIAVTVYLDGKVADGEKVKAQMSNATIYRSSTLPNGKQVVSHAKFVIVDHQVVLLTSANFSYSAEQTNVEFGLRIDDAALAQSIESTMSAQHGLLYEQV